MHGDRAAKLTSALRSFEVATKRVSNTARHAYRRYLEHNALADSSNGGEDSRFRSLYKWNGGKRGIT